jgi:tetratricopeptide (TPR) repeat protein
MTRTCSIFTVLVLFSCSGRKDQAQFETELASLNLTRGEITLCGSGEGKFGTVSFGTACSEEVQEDFNLATALLHSFEYSEAEKVFARIIDADPMCVFAYWGAAMSNFHPMWEPPSPSDLQKGARIIALARSLVSDKSSRESDYIESIATIYDQWEALDHRTRLGKFTDASQKLFEKYPSDNEAAIFYALSLTASASPADKTFRNQKQAGQILTAVFEKQPDHPGAAHYIIHTFDSPELAELALPTARKYAELAPASAHAQHMPSHIFTRLGLWDESVSSNLKSIAAAQCYAESMNISGHWDEELHGTDYAIYAYLQQANDEKALRQIQYLQTIDNVFPQNFKGAYSFAAGPTRYALERKDWTAAMNLEFSPSDFPWESFPWERSNINFGRLLGAVHANKLDEARRELEKLRQSHETLTAAKDAYKSNLVLIQVNTGDAWIRLAEGKESEAIALMNDAAVMEEATAKHPVTPGEVVPARELLGDMYMETKHYQRALEAYELDLKNHPNRFNGLYGAGLAAEKAGDRKKAFEYYGQLLSMARPSGSERKELIAARSFVQTANNVGQ